MNIKSKLKIVLFLQFFIWGSWLITFGSYMINVLHFTGIEVGAVYGTMGIASLIMPSLLGIIADKWIPANYLYILCHFISAITLFLAASITSPLMMMFVILINSFVYMPTIAMSNSISYFSLESNKYDIINDFPGIRVFGTIGFIIAMWFVSLLKLELSNIQLYISAVASLLLCACTLLLPKVPVSKKQAGKQSLGSLLGLDAFVLFKQPRMAIFFLFSVLLGAVLQVTNTFGSPFLHDFALNPQFKDSLVVQYPSILLSISQISEVVFILFVPFFLKRLGIKYVMLISMIAWAIRFGLFIYGDPSPIGFIWLFLSMIVYGCAFDFFNISGSIYVEKSVEPKVRNSAQGLFMTMTNGLGAYLGSMGSGFVVDYFTHDGIKDWPNIWLVFALYSLILATVFMFVFKNDQDEFNLKSNG
ncbi:nucleoside permease [Orbus sturtevantii]|uniref:nucleoside permease n=1 Tax=Orbus sturtevantii TaxID=3074109 RepID=UPI00370DBDAB